MSICKRMMHFLNYVGLYWLGISVLRYTSAVLVKQQNNSCYPIVFNLLLMLQDSWLCYVLVSICVLTMHLLHLLAGFGISC